MKLLVPIIFLLSFLSFSLYFTPYLTSDDALNVLMANDYHLPHDIYCWGQDRGGTLIPLLSQIFIFVGIIPLLSVSISNYLVLFLGYYGFSKLFKNNYSKVLFALFWFLPYERFINLTSFPIGMGYSLIGFSILFLLKIINNIDKKYKNWFLEYINYFIVLFLWGLSIWVSDLSIITILVLLSFLILKLIKQKTTKPFLKKFVLVNFIGFLLIGIVIKFLKSFATDVTENFNTFNTLKEIINALLIVFEDCKKVLLFETNEVFVTIGAWGLIILLLYAITQLIKKRKEIFSIKSLWVNFFLFDLLVILGVIFSSHWVFLNNMGRWYFVSTYISFALLFVSFLDSHIEHTSKITKVGILCVVAFISISSILTPIIKLKGDYQPMSFKLAELSKLGKIGIIADYWDSYRCSIVDPKNIISTPHEGDEVKNIDLVSDVFNQPRIFISRDMWFDKFPDTLTQFGFKLKKHKNEFLLGGSNLCEYKIVH